MADAAMSALVFAGTEWLVACLLHTTVLIGSTWAVLRLVPLSPATQNVLWKVALVAGIATATLVAGTAPVRPDPALEGVHREIRLRVADERPTDAAVDGTVAYDRSTFERRVLPSTVDRVELRSAFTARVADPVAFPLWTTGLLGLWLCGMVCGIGGQLARGRGLRVVRGSLRPPARRARRLLEELRHGAAGTGLSAAARGRIGRARLFVSSLVSGPCVLPGGILVLSDRCEDELTDPELRAALAHELAHVGRGDLTWSSVARWIGVLLWMQPLGRLVRSRLSGTSEVLCDEWAVRVTGEPYGLASSIARVAEWATHAPDPEWGLAMVGRGRYTLSDRVRRILEPASGRVEPRWLGALFVVLLVVPLCWLPTAAPSRPATDLVFERFEEVDVVHSGARGAGERRIIVARASIDGRKGLDLLQRGLTPILAGR